MDNNDSVEQAQNAPEPKKGTKHDQGKDDYWLLPYRALQEVIRVLMFGAKNHGRENWKQLDDPKRRFFNAAQRHLTDWRVGETFDRETGLHNLAHATCCMLFILWFELVGEKKG
ncbi:dATP/dGTP diphosphohydrolase domain-containing protein [Algicola sagamiensis]|uniref:dATP/dGTP diphosphohydrolase domain-containing protein n=1 Tax=Algicola sagamiensis TaxID=163869 RepID=UPI0003691025|nr:dATP/dGTP diphosphohydrolase domain-containing protein [Algicola sagamiensis]